MASTIEWQDEYDGRAFHTKLNDAHKTMSKLVPPTLDTLKSEIRSILDVNQEQRTSLVDSDKRDKI